MTSEVKTKLTRKPLARTAASNRNWKLVFLAAMRDISNVSHACRVSKVSRNAAYKAKDEDAQFSADWDDALKEGFDSLEAEMIKHAKHGVTRRVFMKGADGEPKKIDEYREYPYGMASMLLKAHKPSVYREQRDVLNLNATTTAPDGTKAEFVVHLSAEELP